MIKPSRRNFLFHAIQASASLLVVPRSMTPAFASDAAISVADFGALPNGTDAGPGVARAIAHLPMQGGARLHFPPGAYRFLQRSGPVISIKGIDNLELSSPGATFLFDGVAQPLLISSCDGVLIRGFTIDWPQAPFLQGVVETVSVDRRSATLRIESQYHVDGSETFQALATFDPESKLMSVEGIDAYSIISRTELLKAHLLQLWFNRPLGLNVGDYVVLRKQVYGSNAITLRECQHLKLDDVTIHAAPGMAIFGYKCRDVSLSNVHVTPASRGGRLMSTNADGLHLQSCSGTVEIEKCDLAGTGDDCINVHGSYLRVQRVIDCQTVDVEQIQNQPISQIQVLAIGDHVIFEDGATLKAESAGVVSRAQAGSVEHIEFGSSLSPAVRAGDYLIDTTESPSVTISRCSFSGNRARGVLIHGTAVIQKCRFSNQTLEAILVMPDASWMEGPAADDVRIENNQIENVLRSGAVSGAIRVGAVVVDSFGNRESSTGFVNDSVVILNNAFVVPGSVGVLASATSALTIENNRFLGAGSSPAISIDHSCDVYVKNNSFEPQRKLQASNIDNLNISGNRGLLMDPSTAGR